MSIFALAALALANGQPVSPPQTVANNPEVDAPVTVDDRTDPATVIVVRGRSEQISGIAGSALAVPTDGITTIDQLATAVPGIWLVNDQDPGTNILSIRGATTDRLQQASVAVIVDDVPLADTELFTAALFDVTKIDVLRGPQGALFGRNAAGGAIGITTGSSGHDNSSLILSAGNGGHFGAEASLLGPAFGPVDESRFALLVTHADGWITNQTLGKVVDETGTLAARLSLSGSQGGWRWNLRAHALAEEGGAAWASSNNVTGLNGGRLDGAVLTDPIGDFKGRAKREWMQASGRAWIELAGGELRLIGARDSYQKRWIEELDYRPGPLTFFGFPAFPDGIQPISQPIDIEATTLDARWSGQTRFGEVMAGLYWQDTFKGRVDDFGPLLFGAAAPAYDTNSEQAAIYASWRGNLLDRVSLEIQARYDRDQRSQLISNSQSGQVLDRRSATFERVSPRIGLVAQLVENGELYASWSQAFRPGGFNPAPSATSIWQIEYRPEITESAEIGARWRGRLGGGRVNVALALFDNAVSDWQNYTFIDNQSVTLNVPEVAISGVELEASYRANTWAFGGALATLDASIGRFIATDPLLGSPATRDYSDNSIPNSPASTANLWAEAEFWFEGIGFTPRLTVRHAGKTVYEIDNVVYSPARVWFDAVVTINLPISETSITLRGENITDERWAVSAFGQGMTGLLAGLGPDGPFDTFTINRAAVWKIELAREF